MEGFILFYVASFLVGGVILILSALGALDIEVGDIGEGAGFLSVIGLRKVAFFTCFFGLTGLVMRLVAGSVVTIVAASGVGVFCAWVGDAVLRRVAQQVAESGLEPEDLIGLEARVTVPFTRSGRGKVTCEVQGRTVEFLAERAGGGEEQGQIGVGNRVLICSMHDGVATIEPMEG